ncbi:hypothetical protein TSUD_313410 [Trifolium subterraneum]|uniref:Uncharacterized protein n=1 Tax=Trifolium subterraneum TaxID=3900 RepID=A0A2Z6MT46_TRISU|nr:hypothetical protein TSUD_313410 [Trifolium subterraneum]
MRFYSMNYSGWEGMIFIGVNAAIRYLDTKFLVMNLIMCQSFQRTWTSTSKSCQILRLCDSLSISFHRKIFFMGVILLTKDYFAIVFTNSKTLQAAVANLGNLIAVTMGWTSRRN